MLGRTGQEYSRSIAVHEIQVGDVLTVEAKFTWINNLLITFRCIISAAPLTSTFSSVLPIPFYGQFYRTSDNTNFWLKLFYYQLSGFGPPSLLLTKGYVLNNLPRMFLGYGQLLVTIVSTDSYVLNTNNFKSINKQLRNSCVLIQAYGLRNPGELHYESFPFDESGKWNFSRF